MKLSQILSIHETRTRKKSSSAEVFIAPKSLSELNFKNDEIEILVNFDIESVREEDDEPSSRDIDIKKCVTIKDYTQYNKGFDESDGDTEQSIKMVYKAGTNIEKIDGFTSSWYIDVHDSIHSYLND